MKRPTLLLLAAFAAACTTQELHQDTLVAGQVNPSDGASIRLYFSRGDIAPGEVSPLYRVVVDGKLLVHPGWDAIELFSGNGFCCPVIPAGRHTFELRGEDGAAYLTTPLLETRAGLTHHLMVFGHPSAPEYRWFVDDPATVPAGMAHVRLLNAVDDGAALEPLRCPGNAVEACVAAGPAIAFGETFETDSPRDTVGELSWRPVGATQPFATGMVTVLPPDYGSCISSYLRAVLHVGLDGGGISYFDSGLGSGTPRCP
jgi:hypothetical protein